MRALGATRLSRLTEESTSIERQRREIERWAGYHGATVIGMAEDSHVSGAVSPFDRPSLGPWLTLRTDEWDVLVVTQVDRLGRKTADVHALAGYLKDRGKRLVVIDIDVDSGKAGGTMILSVMAALAEMERDAIVDRTRKAYAHLVQEKRWRGGLVPYGYTPEPLPKGGYRLVIDPVARDVVVELARRITGGESVNAVALDLNERGVLPPLDHARQAAGNSTKGQRWHNSNTRRLLKSETLLGRMAETLHEDDGREVASVQRDAAGVPLERAEPLLPEEDWKALQAALAGRQTRKQQKHPSPLLTGMLWCECGERMNRNVGARPWDGRGNWHSYYAGRGTGYYRCASVKRGKAAKCPGDTVREDETDASALLQWRLRVGTTSVLTRHWVPGNDVARERRQAAEALERLLQDERLFRSGDAQRLYRLRLETLNDYMADLESQEAVEGHYEVVDTGRTYVDRGELRNGRNRRVLEADMRAVGARVIVSHAGEVRLVLPEDVEARLSEHLSSQ